MCKSSIAQFVHLSDRRWDPERADTYYLVFPPQSRFWEVHWGSQNCPLLVSGAVWQSDARSFSFGELDNFAPWKEL